MLSLNENAKMLSDFGLTHNQAKVYIAITQIGIASVSQVSKVSKVRREDIYRMLPKLEKMGLIEKILGTPIRIRATPMEEALSILIKRERDVADKRVSALKAKKDKFLKHFKPYKIRPIFGEEEAHFALLSQREGVINRVLTMVKKAEREIDVITSIDEFIHVFTNYAGSLREAIRKGVKVRVILDTFEHEDLIMRVLEEYKSTGASFDLKCTDQPSGHFILVDYKEALIATSTEGTMGKNPRLWTDENVLVGLVQKKFEGLWHASVDIKTIETDDVAEKVTRFVKHLSPSEHAIFLYQSPEAKYEVLFNYLKVGLDNGEAAVYIASEENPSQIRDAMKQFGIEVEKNEKKGALRILGYKEYYIIDGKFDITTTMCVLKKLYDEAMAKGFRGWRGAGEMACFFEHNLVQDLIEYERALHRVLDLPIIGVCAYNANAVIKASNPMDLYHELLKAHGTILFTGIDNKLGKIEIRRA